jgi:hypothetical protein
MAVEWNNLYPLICRQNQWRPLSSVHGNVLVVLCAHLRLPCTATGMTLMARLTFNLLDYNEFFGQTHSLGLGTATSAGTALFWMSVILLQVKHCIRPAGDVCVLASEC